MTVGDHKGFWSKLQTNGLRSTARAALGEARRFVRMPVAAMVLVLVGGALVPTGVRGQQATQPTEIDPQELQEKPYVCRFTQRPGEIRIHIKGDDVNYQWVRVSSDGGLTIKAVGDLDGYKKPEEVLQTQTWYQFKKLLPLTVMIKQGDEAKYDLKLEFGKLKQGVTEPGSPDEARRFGATDKVKKQKGRTANIRINDDSRPIIKVEPLSLTFERPRDANSAPPQEALQLSTVDSSGSKPIWAFVKFDNPDLDVSVDNDADGEKSTAAPGGKLENDRFFGFAGSLKLVVTGRVLNDDTITLTLQGGRGVGELVTHDDAVNAAKNPTDQIAIKGPELKVQIATVKPTAATGASSYLTIIIISAVGLALLVAFFVWKRRSKAMVPGGGPSASNLLGGPHPDFSSGAGSEYDRLTPAQGKTKVVKQPQPSWFGRVFSLIGLSNGESEEEKAAYKRRMSDQRAAEAARLAEVAARVNTAPPPDPVREPAAGAAEPTVREAHVDALKPKEVERISQDMLNRAVAESAEASVTKRLDPIVERVEAINELMNELQASFNNHRSTIRSELDIQKAATAEEGRTTRTEFERKLESRLNQFRDDIQRARDEFDKRLNNIESDSQASQAEQDKRDGSYAALLSSILERSVDGLQGDSLSSTVREAADSLNKFFQTQIPRSEVLDELASRAERIRSSLKAVVDRAGAFNSQAEIDIAEPLQKVTNLVAELSVMRAQLRSRQLTLEARVALPVTSIVEQSGATPYDPKLPIPVSAHSKARYTFIEELGFAIKREMDKFRDPPGYFRREIERLVTSDVISVADICDSKTKNNELEQCLQVLFSEARLRSILPKPKEQFDPTEQSIIQITSGGTPADSQKIAKVVSRGFYYNDGEKERLLRKAGVEVYR